MFLLEESINLLWKVLEEGKTSKENLNNQQREFLKVASKAVRRTLSYIGENKKNIKTQKELSDLWAAVALAARPFDSDLAERCYQKGNYWANPDNWSDEEVKKAGIEIGRIDAEIRRHFKGNARAKKSKQQITTKKIGQRNKGSIKKFSWKKIWTIVVSSIVILAAFTTLILNLDKIYEIKKCPDLYVNVFSPTPILGKAIFEFGNNVLSRQLDFEISLQNKGDRKSVSLTKFALMFNKTVEVSLKSHGLWEEKKDSPNFKTFIYLKDDVTVNSDTSRRIGIFALSIPPKQAEPLLVAFFVIEGDFERKVGLIYYDYLNEKYNVVHYTNPNRAIEIWNRRLNQ
jgi:hypothetical protein